MLTFGYNIIQLTVLALFWPALLLLVLAKAKYRKRIPSRLGFGLRKKLQSKHSNQTTFWIHGLSVGEITSAAPLVTGLRNSFPNSCIVISAATETGEAVAHKILADSVDHIISAPLDALPVTNHFCNQIQPDVYILIETDFWPNILTSLTLHNSSLCLVNGRISEKSFKAYRKFSWFFIPLFKRFQHISMQTEADKGKMCELLQETANIHTLGNLKYDTPSVATSTSSEIGKLLPAHRLIIVAGSTHPGEEQIVLQAYSALRNTYPDIYLVVAPRNPKRADEILKIGKDLQLQGVKRTDVPNTHEDFLVVDTIGELVPLYQNCHISFVGGSFVNAGGHNPIEPAIMSLPVLFGPHMEDFQEIAADLVAAGGALQLPEEQLLLEAIKDLIDNEEKRHKMGLDANNCIASQQGIITRHTDLIASLL